MRFRVERPAALEKNRQSRSPNEPMIGIHQFVFSIFVTMS
jgi:hypothetical protein